MPSRYMNSKCSYLQRYHYAPLITEMRHLCETEAASCSRQHWQHHRRRSFTQIHLCYLKRACASLSSFRSFNSPQSSPDALTYGFSVGSYLGSARPVFIKASLKHLVKKTVAEWCCRAIIDPSFPRHLEYQPATS